jgi:hypothetical protein
MVKTAGVPEGMCWLCWRDRDENNQGTEEWSVHLVSGTCGERRLCIEHAAFFNQHGGPERGYRDFLAKEGCRCGYVPDPAKPAGLYRKYNVSRVDRDPDGKHKDCFYFVLDPAHDPIAREALTLYANRCEPILSADLKRMLAKARAS